MTNVLIVPNTFKGTLSSSSVADIIEKSIMSAYSCIKIKKCPLADGGDGSLEAILNSVGGEVINVKSNDPLFREINSFWLKLGNELAVIEAAKANGLSLLRPEEYNPFVSTTYGVGELIIDAVNKGCKEILLFIGGSATNDAGYGALKALGVKFLDKFGYEIDNNIRAFKNIDEIDLSGMDSRYKNIKFRIATDVANPLLGKNGASFVYAKQKGARDQDLTILDEYLKSFADKCSDVFGVDNRDIPGSGAAGGLGFGLCQVFNVEFVSGFDEIAKLINLEEMIKWADIVITGEGKLDNQSIWGKVPVKVAQLAIKYGKRCIAIVGINEHFDNSQNYFDQIISIVNDEITVSNALKYPKESLALTLKSNLGKIFQL